MSNQTVNFVINVTGDANSVVQGITRSTTEMNETVSKSLKLFGGWEGKVVALQQLSQVFSGMSEAIDTAIQPGIALNTSLQDLSAITGVTGKGLKEIEGYARDTAKAFGVDAAGAVESYKLVLSQLSPEIAKTPAALQAMGSSIATLSKTMGGDTAAAAEVLTTAMNQFQVSTADPIAASREMARMMNVMAAAAKEGSAELPQIKEALSQSGMAAKAAGVSFEETNAAIQVLDKAGKKGAEGGVALRNVMNILSRGRFLPPEVQKELQAAGVDMETLTDKSKTLTERLRPLNSVLDDSALFSKLFGMENTNAAMALVSGIDEVDRYKSAITGTNTAMDQAKTVMESYAEKQARIQARFDDLKISIFNATGDMGIWLQTVAKAAVPLAQLTPLLLAMGNGIKWIKGLDFSGMLSGISHAARRASISLAFMLNDIKTCNMASLGFRGNIIRATLAVVRFATVGIFNAIKGLGAYVLSLITGGTASATFATIASGSFAAFATSAKVACKAVSMAIKSIPIIGWIIAIAGAIAGLIAFIYRLWKTCAGFRRVVSGVWESVKAVLNNAWVGIKTFFQVIFEVVKSGISLIWNIIQTIFSGIGNVFASIGNFFAGLWQRGVAAASTAFQWVANLAQGLWTGIVNVFASIGNFFAGLWQRGVAATSTAFQWVANLAQGLWTGIVNVFASIGNFFATIWDGITKTVVKVTAWIQKKLAFVGNWIKTTLVEPIQNSFSNIWTVVKQVFDKIIAGLGKLFAPIKELWNKIFPKDKFKDVAVKTKNETVTKVVQTVTAAKGETKSVKQSYKAGADKATAKSNKDKSTENTPVVEVPDISVTVPKAEIPEPQSMTGGGMPDNVAGNNRSLDSGDMGRTAGISAGETKQITITLESMVGTMNFNGGLQENAQEVESVLSEQLARILGMAETAA